MRSYICFCYCHQPYGTGKRLRRWYCTTDMEEENAIEKVDVALATCKKGTTLSNNWFNVVIDLHDISDLKSLKRG